MAPAPSVERVLRGVLRYLADALMLQLMSGGWMPWVGWRGSGRVGLGWEFSAECGGSLHCAMAQQQG